MKHRSVRFGIILALALLAANAAAAITVEVNGQRLPSDPPAVQIGGRVMLPMRVVFEALGASVRWESATQTAVGVRGDTTVVMSIGRTTGYINDRAVTLDVPPQLIRGNTYMPVRFPAEAFGADVRWAGATQTVSVDLTPEVVVEPPTTPPTGPITGVLTAITNQQVVLDVNGTLTTFTLRPNTALRQDGRQVTTAGLVRGSLATVEQDAQGNVTRVEATQEDVTDAVTGVLTTITNQRIVLDVNGTLTTFTLRANTTLRQDGREVTAAGLVRGSLATVEQDAQGNVTLVDATREDVTDAVTGRLTNANAQRVVLDVDGTLTIFNLRPNTTLRQDGREVTAAGLVRGSLVTVEQDAQGNVTLLEATRDDVTGAITGVLTTANNQRVVLEVNGALTTFTLRPNTTLRQDGREVTAAGLVRGSLVTVEQDAQGNTTLVEASLGRNVTGAVIAKAARQVLLDTRAERPYAVSPEVTVVTSTGRAASYADIRDGDRVSLQLTPDTAEVFRIVIEQGATTTATDIAQFSHGAIRPLKAGDTLRVTMDGTPGGTATFDIGDVRTRLPLVEDPRRPGRYNGEYRVERNINAAGIELIGRLEMAGQVVATVPSEQPVTIDTIPPQVTIFGPGQGERTTNPRPNIGVLITDENGSGVDFEGSTVTLTRGGQTLGADTERRGATLSILPDRLSPGQVRVTAKAFDQAGNTTDRTWTFTVAAGDNGEEALAVNYDAIGMTLMPGDTLTVTATGPEGATGVFDLGAWRRGVRMRAVPGEPGTYEGTFTVPNLTQDREEVLTATLTTADGRQLVSDATTPVRFGPTRLLVPRIISPVANAAEGDDVVVEGETQPFSLVDIQIAWRGTSLGIFDQTGQVVDTQVTADARGRFQTDAISLRVGGLLPVKNLRYTLTCTSTDPRGATSDPVTVEFTK